MIDPESLAYGELLARLRKDLQLDATTDLLPGSLARALMPGTTLMYLKDTAGKAPFAQLATTAKVFVSWGEVLCGVAGTIVDAGSADWTVVGTAANAVQLQFGTATSSFVVAVYQNRAAVDITVQTSDVTGSPVLSTWQNGVAVAGQVIFLAVHN